ncbi:LemA family protein, partial [Escherichia coli]|nr:LemA family protein [Escherichia coli]
IEQYNVTIRKFPAVLTAKVMDYTPKKNYLPDDVAAVSKAPTIDFSQNANAH